MKAIITTLLLLIFGSVCANVCEVKSGKVQIDGTSYGKDAWIEGCAGGLEVISQQAEICFFNQLKQWHCTDLKEGAETTIEDLAIKPEYAKGFFDALVAIWRPDSQANYGGKRLKEGEYLSGFPYGEILKPEKSLNLNTDHSTKSGIAAFSIVNADSQNEHIFSVTNAGNTVAIPTDVLRAGMRYTWTLQSGSVNYSGNFSIASEADQQEFEQDLNGAQGELSGAANQLLLAAIAREYGYTFDYQQALNMARQTITSEKKQGAP